MKFMPELSRNKGRGIASRSKDLGRAMLSHTPLVQQRPERRTGLLAAAAGAALAVGGLIALNVISRRKAMSEDPTQHIAFADTAPSLDGQHALGRPGAETPLERPGGALQ